VNLYSLFVYIEHNGDESPKDTLVRNTVLYTQTSTFEPSGSYQLTI